MAAGDLDPVEAVEGALAAMEGRAELNAVLTDCANEALARARAGVSGRLAGVPLLVKDLIDTAGVRTTYASRIYADHVPERSAPAVLALEAEGAIVVGKANADEFAWGVSGQNVHWGDTQNPRLPGRLAGGSSSGNAAALAAGLVPLTLGSDTGGSVRMPAACCGVVGLKPTTTGAPAGAFPLCASLDTIGPMARTVADCALAHAVLRGSEVPEARIAGLGVGLLTRPPELGPASPAQAERDERALGWAEPLEALGARAEEVSLSAPEADLWALFYAEAAASHRATFPARRDEYGPTIRAKLEQAVATDPAAVARARAAHAAWREQAAAEPAVDLLVAPTLGLAEIPPIDADELEIRVPFSAYTRTFNFLGWPAIAIGGLQLAARDETTLLGAALAWEQAYGSSAA